MARWRYIHSLVGTLLEMLWVRLAFLAASSGSSSPCAILKQADPGKSLSPWDWKVRRDGKVF